MTRTRLPRLWLACAGGLALGACVSAVREGAVGAPEPVALAEGSPEASPSPVQGPRSDGTGAPGENAPRVGRSPAELYASCRDRVEGGSTAGECATDADCVRTGCSQEVCVAASQADIVTTCEILPCFQVLDACGCREGVCGWSLKAEAPAGRRLPGFPVAPAVGGDPSRAADLPR